MPGASALQPTLWRSCRVLANRRRLRILGLLVREPDLTVSTVARQLKLTLPAASQSLRALEARSLLSVRRVGSRAQYRLAVESPARPLHGLVGALRNGFRRDPEFAETVFRLATAFTHPRRIGVFRALQADGMTPRQLRAVLAISRFSLMRHLTKLESRGFLVRREGRYEVVPPRGALARVLVRLALA